MQINIIPFSIPSYTLPSNQSNLLQTSSYNSHPKKHTCMSTFNLSKKLQPGRNAWRSFKNHLRLKLHYPKVVKTVTIIGQRCRAAYQSFAPLILRKFLSLTKRDPPHLHHYHSHCHRFHPSYSPIYVDELFPSPSPLSKTEQHMAESSYAKSVNKSRPYKSQPVDQMNARVHVDDETGLAASARRGKAETRDELFPGPSLLRKPNKSMAESSSAKSVNKSRPDQTTLVDQLTARVHVDDETGLAASARKGKAEAGNELFLGPALLRNPNKKMAESRNAKSVNESRPDQTQPVDRVSARTHVGDETGLAAAARKEKADKWKIPMLPQLRGIDERAEEFIAKFRQDMKLEREQSILEYEEMLKRSA